MKHALGAHQPPLNNYFPKKYLNKHPTQQASQTKTIHYIFGFPLVPLAPRSSFVTSVSLVSAFKLTGSPNCVGLPLSILSCATCFNVLPSPLPLEESLPLLAPKSFSVGLVSEVSALRETGSPICEGLVSFFSSAMCLRDFLGLSVGF